MVAPGDTILDGIVARRNVVDPLALTILNDKLGCMGLREEVP